MIVRVFRNLTAGRKGKAPVYSIQAKVEGRWRTVAHASYACLSDAEFRVSKAGVARIRATGKKQVVATVQGALRHWAGDIRNFYWLRERLGGGTVLGPLENTYRDADKVEFPDPVRETCFQTVAFNPYKMDTFQVAVSGAAIERAGSAWIGERGVVASVEAWA